MTSLETFLARLYTDSAFAIRAREAPRECARAAGLSEAEAGAVARIDWTALDLAAESFAAKREAAARPRRPGEGGFLCGWVRLWRRIRRSGGAPRG